jgi:hypothetical protein
MKPFRVVAGLDPSPAQSDKKALAEARKSARPILKEWLRRIELAVMAGELSPLDYLMAKELCNYPSSNEGRCYAGQERLGAAVGATARTARSSLKRLREREFVYCKRGGPGHTASWTFCVNGKPIFGGVAFLPTKIAPMEEQRFSAQDRKDVSGLDGKGFSAKPSEQDPIERNPSPLPPTTASGRGTSVGLPSSEVSRPVDGEVITGVISFQEFWLAAGRKGHEGFARGEWRKLSASDKAAISDRLQRDGRLSLRNLWAGTWLRDRVWDEAPLPEPETCCDFSRRTFPQHAEPGSALWRAERERLRAAGHGSMVKLMDEFAVAGKGWTVQVRGS